MPMKTKMKKKPRNFSTFVEKFIGPKSNTLAYEKLVRAKLSSPEKNGEKWCVDCSLQCSKTIDERGLTDSLCTALKLRN